MTLIDTSAWVEFLRGTGSPVQKAVSSLLREPAPISTTDPILMELLSGARDQAEVERLRALLGLCDHLRVDAPADFEDAAGLYRACREAGDPPRAQIDCLIAAVAIRNGVELLTADQDFTRIARHSRLVLAGTSRT